MAPTEQPEHWSPCSTNLLREGINLRGLNSRPSKDALGVYIFLIDLQGHRLEPRVVKCWKGCAPVPTCSKSSVPIRVFMTGKRDSPQWKSPATEST